jgi:gamma-glutamylcyclotransferase (GGCT)/AIG2-like uncharacterized protein YtfP
MYVMGGRLDFSSIPFVVKTGNDEDVITVEIFKSTHSRNFDPEYAYKWGMTLTELDWLEGHPSWYKRELARTSDGSEVWLYTMDEGQKEDYIQHSGHRVPTGDWLNPVASEEVA